MAIYGVQFVATFTAYDTTAGTYKTGDSANISLQWTKDGTDAATTNSCSEVDATNSPGLYRVTITAAEATCAIGQLSGKSSTGTNIIITGHEYFFDSFTSVIPAGGIKALGHVDAGTMQSGSTGTTAVLRAAAGFAGDELNGHTIQVVGGTGAGQSRLVDDYTGASDTAAVSPAWTTTPDNTSEYIVWPSPPGSTGAPVPANTTQIAGQTANASGAVTFPTSIASPTNITAGTITTVTNLTNAPSAGDFTATMKTSIGTAVAASAVASVTGNVGGNVGGNVTGSVGSLAGSAGIKKNTAKANFMFVMTDSTTHVPATGLTVAAERSLDGAAFAACANAVSELSDGWYVIDLAAGDLNGDTVALKFTATGADQLNISLVTGP